MVFNKYYTKTDDTPLYAAALILYPNCHTEYIKTNWPAKWVKAILKKVKELWEFYRERAPLNPSIPTLYNTAKERPQEKELDVFDQIAQNLKKYTWPASQDEFQDYCNRELYDIGKMTALEWWCLDQQRKCWPRLSYMALDILSIPAMSDKPEQVFSGACCMVSWDRAQMEAETLKKIECLKHWKQNGILNKVLNKE